MSEIKRILEQYLKVKFRDKTDLSIKHFDKLIDGWESDNYLLTIDYGGTPHTPVDWVWRIYSGARSQVQDLARTRLP